MVDVFNIALSSRRARIFPDRRTLLLIVLDFTATTRCKRLTPASGSLCVRYLRLSGTKAIPSTMSMFSEKSMVARKRTVVPDGDETRLSTGASARRHRASRHRPGKSFGTWLDFLVECRSGGCAHHAVSCNLALEQDRLRQLIRRSESDVKSACSRMSTGA